MQGQKGDDMWSQPSRRSMYADAASYGGIPFLIDGKKSLGTLPMTGGPASNRYLGGGMLKSKSVLGVIERITPGESDAYVKTRQDLMMLKNSTKLTSNFGITISKNKDEQQSQRDLKNRLISLQQIKSNKNNKFMTVHSRI